eukprot:XP_014037194.1 PREDICTED: uncharacterized protein LOC106590599 [Salmo salar]
MMDPETFCQSESDQMSPDETQSPLDLIDTGKGLKVQTTTPHLVSLGSGRLSVAITLLPLKEVPGVTRIGREEAVIPQDIPIQGTEHCVITLDPYSNLCSQDGVAVTSPVPLIQVSYLDHLEAKVLFVLEAKVLFVLEAKVLFVLEAKVLFVLEAKVLFVLEAKVLFVLETKVLFVLEAKVLFVLEAKVLFVLEAKVLFLLEAKVLFVLEAKVLFLLEAKVLFVLEAKVLFLLEAKVLSQRVIENKRYEEGRAEGKRYKELESSW